MLRPLVGFIDGLIALLGRLVSLAILAVIVVMITEMVSRGIFSYSLPWAEDVSEWLLVAIIFLGGPWALARGNFVRVDVLYARFGRRTRMVIDSTLTTLLLLIFCGVLICLGGDFFLKSFAMGERSATGAWPGPVWLPKALLPIGACGLLLAWLSHLFHLWTDADRKDSENAGHG